MTYEEIKASLDKNSSVKPEEVFQYMFQIGVLSLSEYINVLEQHGKDTSRYTEQARLLNWRV